MAASVFDSTTGTTTAALPAGAVAGDLIVVFAYRNAATAPTLPANWTNVVGATRATSPAILVATRVYDGVWTMPTFTNATRCHAIGVRGWQIADPIGVVANQGATSTTVTWAVINTEVDTGTSIVLRGAVGIRPDVIIPVSTGHTGLEGEGTNPGFRTQQANDSSDTAQATSTVTRSDVWSTAQLEIRGQITKAVGQASETDTAQPVTWAPKRRLLGQAVETDTAQPITAVKSRTVGQAEETDTAQPITAVGGATPGIVRVQDATPTSSSVSGTTLTITLPNDVAVGDHIIVACGYSGALGVTVTVTDQAGNTYQTDVITDDGNSTGAYSALASAKVTTALTAGQTITMTVSSSVTFRMMAAHHYSGLHPTTWLDSASNTGKGTSTSPASGTINPTGANLLVLGACGFNSGTANSHTAGGAFTEIDEVHGTTKGLAVDEQINVGPGAYQDTGTLSTSVLWSNSIAAYVAAPTGSQTIPVGQAEETDTAQPITPSKARAVGQPSTTDTAQPITARKTRLLGQASETDTAQPVTFIGAGQTIPVGQASETDTAQPVTWAPKIRLLGQPSTTDTAQPVTARKTRAVGQASTTDTAQPVTASKARAIAQASTSDTAQPITARKTRAIAQAVTTDTAQPITARKARAVGQASTTDTAAAIGRLKTRLIGEPLETDTARPITARKTRLLGQPSTTDTAGQITAPSAADAPDEDRPAFLTLTARTATVVLTDHDATAALTARTATVALTDHDATAALTDHQAGATLTDHEATVELTDHDASAAISG